VEVAPEDMRAPEPGAIEEGPVDGAGRVADHERRPRAGETHHRRVAHAGRVGQVELEYRRQVERAQQGAAGGDEEVPEAAPRCRAGERVRVPGLARSERAAAPRSEYGGQPLPRACV